MIKRIEFTLNLGEPTDAALYEALAGLLRHRRAGSLIRQALAAFLLDVPKPHRIEYSHEPEIPQIERVNQADDVAATRMLEKSAVMFGFQ